MKIFLLWRSKDPARPAADPATVLGRLASAYEPLLEPGFARTSRSVAGTHLVWLELPVRGFRAAFLEEEDGAFAFAPEYPLNARRILRGRGEPVAEGRSGLLALGRALEADARSVLRELIPPAALIWSTPGGSEVRVQNDGLGQAPLYEHEGEHLWALTNRVCALRSLGVELRPSPEEWAARFTAHWFPELTSGFVGVRLLAGGTGLRIGPEGIRRERHDPLGEWVNPPARGREDCLEQGRHALLDHLSDAMELWEKPTVGLSGGWDSRCVVACLRVLGADFELRVRGQETHFDVLISAALARMADLPLRIKTEGGVPASTPDGLRECIAKALLWQSGNYTTLKHKSFLSREGKDRLDGGVVNVMGQHAGIGKGDHARLIQAQDHPPERYEELLLAALMADTPPILRRELRENVHAVLQRAYRVARDRGLTGRGPLHFFFLNEYTRRWGSSTVAGQTGLVVTPFLNPEFIRACYAFPEDELVTKPMHRHATALHAPDWAAFPYTDQATEEDLRSGLIPPVELPRDPEDGGGVGLPRWRQTARFRRYHYKYYWKDVGKPLVKQALSSGGFWTELFEPDAARQGWQDFKGGGDLLLIAHLLPEVLAGALP